MRLTRTDLAVLPLAAAAFDATGASIAATPEWRGPGAGSVTFSAGQLRLVVSPPDHDADIASITKGLLTTLSRAARAASPEVGRRLEMVAAGLALVSGRIDGVRGTTDDVLAYLDSILPLTFGGRLIVDGATTQAVAAPAVVALALRQVIRNADRHDAAVTVRMRVDPGPSFTLRWRGSAPAQGIRTSRSHLRRRRWGLGYVRLAADALGAVYLAPQPVGDGVVEATLAIDHRAPRLALPVAAVGRDGIVERASPAFVEETGVAPGRRISGDDLVDLVRRASAGAPGLLVRAGPLTARALRTRVWVGLEPEGTRDRAREVAAGVQHESDVLDGSVREPHRTELVALSQLLAATLGDPLPRWRGDAFASGFPRACAALGVRDAPVHGGGPVAPDPSLAAYLLAAAGGRLEIDADGARLRLDEPARHHPVVRRLADASGVIRW